MTQADRGTCQGGQEGRGERREEKPSKGDTVLQRPASESARGGHGLRNEEGRRKWRWVWTSLSGGWLWGKAAKGQVGSGHSHERGRDLVASVLGEGPSLRIHVESGAQCGGAGKGPSTVAGSLLLPHWGQGLQLLAGDRSRKGGALWGGALFSLGPGGWGRGREPGFPAGDSQRPEPQGDRARDQPSSL